MKYERVVVAGLGVDLPPQVLSSAAIEDRLAPVYERLRLHAGRIELMTGIRERRFWPEEVRPSAVASAAGRRALEDSGVDPDRIGCVIHASVCRDFLEPATANIVHDTLKLPSHAQVFDVSNACLGVLNGMLLVANMIELGQIEAGLVVAGENGRPLVDSTIAQLLDDASVTRKSIKGAFASLTIGSGAAAVVLCREDLAPAGHRLRSATVENATQHHELCRGGGAAAEGHAPLDSGVASSTALAMQTDAEALLHAGIALAERTYARFGEERSGPPDRVVTHQVGKAHHSMLFNALGLDPASGYVSFDRLGNVGSVSVPMTLHLAVEAGFVTQGHRLALMGIGSGLSCVMIGVDW